MDALLVAGQVTIPADYVVARETIQLPCSRKTLMSDTTINARSHRRILVIVIPLLSPSLLLLASASRADTMTYSVISNPQPDIHNGSPYMVDVSGTMTIDNTGGSAIGTFDSTNDSDVSVMTDLTMSTTAPGVSPITVADSVPLATAFNIVTTGELFATPTSLSIGSNTYFTLATGGGMLGDNYLQLLFDTHDTPGFYNGAAGVQGPPETMQFENTDGDQYLSAGQWEIAAAVPEPGTLTPLGSALVGLAVVGLRRRRASAA